MYIGAQTAMRRRRRIENPEGGVLVMQQPDLGKLGRFVGPSNLTLGTLGTVVDMNAPDSASTPAVSSFSFTPWILGGGLLLLGFLWYRSRSGGGGGHLLPRGLPGKFKSVLQLAGASAGGYVLGKYF